MRRYLDGWAALAAVLALLLGLLVWWATGPAYGAPGAASVTPAPCMSGGELWSMPGGLTRGQVERRAGVEGFGMAAYGTPLGDGWVYPKCAHPGHLAFVGFRHGRSWVVGSYAPGDFPGIAYGNLGG